MHLLRLTTLLILSLVGAASLRAEEPLRRYLYAATPGFRDYLQYGGHGVLVFDIDAGHKFVRRIPTGGVDAATGKPLNVKGICADAPSARLYISTIRTLMALDLVTEKLLWERSYPNGCDRMALSPDGKTIYLPSLEKENWYIVEAATGDVLTTIEPKSRSHNTVFGPDGKECYLAGLGSPLLTVADAQKHTVLRTVGPFAAPIRPFTIDARQERVYVNINELLGFEIGDLRTGEKLARVEVSGFQKGAVRAHGCPSHGIGLTPDETEIWVTDAHNRRMHLFDNKVFPPKQLESIELRDEPGWIVFSLDGRFAWPSTGDVIDVKTRQILTTLTDDEGRGVQSEKMLEIDFRGTEPANVGNQFGIGRNAAR